MTATTKEGALAPSPVAVSDVPAGFRIEYFQDPKRHYRIDGVIVPSVTEALDVLDKPALPWWGMKIGIQGMLELGKRGVIDPGTFHALAFNNPEESAEYVISALTQNQLTTNHVRDKAGDRGQSAHDALERWADTGELPDPTSFGFEEEGYVRALRSALEDLHIEPIAQEVMVGSKEHGFAGRYDLRARVIAPSRVVTKVYPKRVSKVTEVPPSTLLIDLKTSKYVYDKHHLQLAAYEEASVSSGYGSSDYRAVLHVQADGRYEFVRVRAGIEHYLPILHAWRAMEEVKELMKG